MDKGEKIPKVYNIKSRQLAKRKQKMLRLGEKS